ncbi:hypothetical protein DVH05_022652 [Phytophthora capsici]|nr:hypothetical protein DVH05_022652 [Phytophthora capsici]
MFMPEGDQAHKRKIVRGFAPHMSNEALITQERRYFALGLARVLMVFVVPSAIVFCTRDWFVDTIVFLAVAFVSLVELALTLYRYYVLWPEGLLMRWEYWTEVDRPGGRSIQTQDHGLLHPQDREVCRAFPTIAECKQDQAPLSQAHVASSSALFVSLCSVSLVSCANEAREGGDAYMGVLFAVNW